MLKTIDETKRDIAAGRRLFLAGDEAALAQLPAGDWIGGTIPYFMDDSGGVVDRTRVFAAEVPAEVDAVKVVAYDAATLPSIATDAYENGFTVLIIPASTDVHVRYAQDAPGYPELFLKPIVGWISGVHLGDLGKVAPKVFDGRRRTSYADRAIAMHCRLKAGRIARIGIVNLFKPGSGDVIAFPAEGFVVKDCLVNRKTVNFADYLREKQIDTKLPLVANYSGMMVNVSFQEVRAKEVALYAPVFKGVAYSIADPVADYVKEFAAALPKSLSPAFSCNCILNFLYSDLEGKKTGAITGPITFGEIAYQLLNQTLVYLEIE